MRTVSAILSAILLVGSASAQLLKNINTVQAGVTDGSSYPRNLVNLGGRAVFCATDGLTGRELWVTDGSAAGTVRLTSFNGSADSMCVSNNAKIARINGRAVFALNDGSSGLEPWVTDGTQVGTMRLADVSVGVFSSYPEPMAVWNGELYFAASDAGTSVSKNLYATDGTPAGTRLVRAFPGTLNTVADSDAIAVAHNGLLYFVAHTQLAGRELWRTDGTSAGTFILADSYPGPGSGLRGLQAASFGSHLYFEARDSGLEYEVWRTDGTSAGTGLFANVNPSYASQPYDFQVIGSNLVFAAKVNGDWQYHSTDGVTVSQLSFPPLRIHLWELQCNGEKLIGMLRDPLGSFELWGTDGTVAGSGVIKQIHPDGSQYVNYEAWRVSSGNKLLFRAGDSVVGSELFVTDGTAAGTGVLADLTPGPSDSNVAELIRMGDSLLFAAFGGLIGYELYRLPWTDVDDWLAEPFGRGCPSSGTVPSIGSSGSAQPGATLTLELQAAAPLTPVFTYWSSTYAFGDLGDSWLYLAAPQFVATSTVDAQGNASLPIVIPSNPVLVGLGLWMQSLVLDVGGDFLGLGALTPALEVRIGV